MNVSLTRGCLLRRRSRVPAACAAALLSLAIAFPVTVKGQTTSERAALAAMSDPQARRLVDEYLRARIAYEKVASAYWTAVADKRRARFAKRRNNEPVTVDDYVLTQPPVYTGPPKPPVPIPDRPELPPARPPVPVVADFLASAATHFKFVPQRPESEFDYKRDYARVAAAAGLTREQVVRIYGFESGGNGRYDVQAGLEYNRPGARAITTALGYNQLLTTNTISLLAEHGEDFVKALRAQASSLPGPQRRTIEAKIAVLTRMIAFSRTVPVKWSEHEALGRTAEGMGLHALILDRDIGPLLQTQKLVNSLKFARMKGHRAPLSAAELELMNLTGDGNGIDMVMMPQALREKVPTANFFQRGGYERNPVASRNNVVAKLISAIDARMDREVAAAGAREMAAAFDAEASAMQLSGRSR